MLKKIFLILSILLLIPNVFAWNWFTHQEIGENVYNALPEDLQNKLNLEKIKEGTIAPDKDFKDNVRHHYPPSYNLTLHWLDVAKNSLETQDYDNASYAFGVATHYVSDSFSAPHYVKNEQYKLHEEYEWQAKKIKTKCKKRSYDLNKELKEATRSGEDWNEWLKTKDSELPQKRIEQAQELTFAIGLELFNAECKQETNYLPIILGITAIIALIIIFILATKKIKIKI